MERVDLRRGPGSLGRLLRVSLDAVRLARGSRAAARHVLRRRGATEVPAGSYAMIRPPAEEEAEPVVKPRRYDLAVLPAPKPLRVSPATARRRRLVLTLLTSSTFVLAVLVAAGVVAEWAVGIPVLLLLTYLVELRAKVRRARRVGSAQPVAPAEPGTRRAVRRARHRNSPEFWDPWPSFDPGDAPVEQVTQLAGSWGPRPVPLPPTSPRPRPSPPPDRDASTSQRADRGRIRAPNSPARSRTAPAWLRREVWST